MRDKIDERRHFYSHEKTRIIKKSKGKCAHCGKPLSKPSEMTVEHIIPLALGGTNEEENLAVLCKECNKDKGEKVLLPSSYLKYLTPKYKSRVDNLFESYCKNVGYFTGKNYLFTDKIDLDIQLRLWSFSKPSNLKSALYKAFYSDLDEIYKFSWAYYGYYGINVDVYDVISSYFDRGAIYYTRNVKGELDFVLFVGLGSYIREEGISYNIALTIISKPELSLTVSTKPVRGGSAYSAYSKDFSYFKLNAILVSFLEGCLRCTQDNNISYGADVSIFWYIKDNRVRHFLDQRSNGRPWVNEDYEDEEMMGASFTTNEESAGVYNWKKATDWNNYVETIYDVEDEIKLYCVLRDKKFSGILDMKARKLRQIREKFKQGNSPISL